MPLVIDFAATPERKKEAAETRENADKEATYNQGLLITTIVLAILAFIQWVAMIWQAVLTRQAVLESNRQHRLSNRASVFFLGFDIHTRKDAHGGITSRFGTVNWKNSGPAMTLRGTTSIAWAEYPTALPPDFAYELPIAQPITLAPETDVGCPMVLELPADFGDRARDRFVYIWGKINYDDTMGNNGRETRFCYRYVVLMPEPNGAYTVTLSEYGPFNGTEDA